jgi:Tfp pilus assembly protein PilF
LGNGYKSSKALSRARRELIFAGALVAYLILSHAACTGSNGLPKVDSTEYRNLVTAFYVGLAGLQTGEDVRAKEKLTLAAQIAPGEPAAWANLGLLAVRQQEFDVAYANVEKARTLAPDNSQIESLLGMIESKRGRLPEAIAHFEKAVGLDGANLKALYSLAQETERRAEDSSDAQARAILDRILKAQPDNLAVLLDATRLAAKSGDSAALKQHVDRLSSRSDEWPVEAKQQLTALEQAAAGPTPRSAGPAVAFLRNVLLRVADYRQSLNAIKTPVEFVGDPFLKFLKLPSPSSSPAPPDLATNFDLQPIPGAPDGTWAWISSVSLNVEGKPSIVVGNRNEMRILNGAALKFSPGAALPSAQTPESVLAIDFNYDFKTDFILAGDGGLRFYRQIDANQFVDVTANTKLPATLLRVGGRSLWAFDFELDGDLDVLCGPQAIVLRNNGDGTFQELHPFGDNKNLAGFAAADFDGDGDPDLAMISSQEKLQVFTNSRLGVYRERAVPSDLGSIVAIWAADINSDGRVDLLALRANGEAIRLSDKNDGREWELAVLASIGPQAEGADRTLATADLDNNGGFDLLLRRARIFLSDSDGKFQTPVEPVGGRFFSAVDLNDDGRLDLLGISVEGKPIQQINRGGKNYHHQVLRTRAAQATGDQRINSFGIGGEVEIRSGLLTQKQIITSPLLHFGLGENTQTDVARIVWPNGLVQAEFELKADESVLAVQRLKGSCPMLFAWDGNRMSFVKDCSPWNPALGLHINAQTVAEVDQTEEWLKIPGSSLTPRDGAYDLRVTAELWESFYIDHYSLMVVDHPPGTSVFTDERFAPPQPKPQVFVTTPPKPFAAARDDRGQDVSATVAALDRHYLDGFGRGQYQGLTRDHWVEVELGDEAPRDKPLSLIGHGWLHPTDATVNIALGQNSGPPPQGLTLETPDATGRWSVAKPRLGFLSGKHKTMVVDLSGVFRPGAPRKLRLRTNMEIYWDQLEWAQQQPAESIKINQLDPATADLSYRGFSTFTQANVSSPELPDYNRLQGSAPRWRDLTGYYTRYGDVRELLRQIDDRLVIMNAGDELRLKIPAPAAPPDGWLRDFVMIGDGWTKDGDYNCVYAATVLPLPYHGIKDYNQASTNLLENPAYQRHPRDWQDYHTRYVTPESFLRALW